MSLIFRIEKFDVDLCRLNKLVNILKILKELLQVESIKHLKRKIKNDQIKKRNLLVKFQLL